MTGTTADRLDQLLATRGIAARDRRRMRGEPGLARLAGGGEQEGGDLDRLLLLEHEVRHASARAELVRVRDPANGPGMVHLGPDAAERRADHRHPALLREVLVALGQVTAVAAELLEEVLAVRNRLRPFEVLHPCVALETARLHLRAAVERLLDEFDVLDVSVRVEKVAVRDLRAVDGGTLPTVAGRAAELIGRMLREQDVAVGMRLPRVRLVLEAGFVDAGVARRAAVDAGDRLVEVVAVELLEHHLLDLRDLRLPVEAEERWARLGAREVAERHALELLLDVVARGGELVDRILRRFDGPLERLDLVLELLDPLLGGAVDRLPLGPQLLPFLDLGEQGLGRPAVMEGVVVEEAQLLELALHEAKVQILALVLLLRPPDLALEVRDLPRVLTRGDARLRLGERLRRRLIVGIGVQALLLGGHRVLQMPDLEAVELGLEFLPRPTEDVVVGDRPQRPHEEEQRHDEPEGPVGPFFIVDDGRLFHSVQVAERGFAALGRTPAREAEEPRGEGAATGVWGRRRSAGPEAAEHRTGLQG